MINSTSRTHRDVVRRLRYAVHDSPPLRDAPEPLVIATPFVGRERELRALRDALEQAIGGAGGLVLLIGEPGIGKTRTTEQLAALAFERGARVLWGSCYEWEGAPTYWPWVQVIRGLIRSVNREQLADDLGMGAADHSLRPGQAIAQIVPEIRERFPELPDPPAVQPEQQRYELFAAISAVVRAAAERLPLVVVLDDLHWADVPSVLLMQLLTQEIRSSRALIVGTYRDVEVDRSHPLAPALAALAREPGCRRMTLRGLRRPDVGRLIEQTTSQAPSERLVGAVWQETDGNPFFVGEVVRLLADEGALDYPATVLARRPWVPESVREVVGRRLGRLAPPCRQLLTVAAIVGREFSLSLLERIDGHSQIELLDLLDDAIRAHLVVEGTALGRFRFSHALVQETLYEELPSAQRVRLHQSVGRALEEASAGSPAPPLAELAFHYYQAAPAGDLDKAIDYATWAGDAAMAQSGWESAVGHFRRALEALDLSGSPDRQRHCDLLLALGDAQNRSGPGSGDVPEARESFLRAAEIARTLPDPERLARAAVGFAGFNIADTHGGLQQIQLLEESLAALPSEDSELRARVMGRLAIDYPSQSPHELERACALANQAVATASRLGDPSSFASALLARYMACASPDNLEERRSDDALLTALADACDDLRAASVCYITQLQNAVEDGDIVSAERAFASLRLAERSQIVYVAQREAAYRGMLELAKGRYREAERLIARASELWQSDTVSKFQAQPFILLRDLGCLDELPGGIRLPTIIGRSLHVSGAYRLLWLLEMGREPEARVSYEFFARNDFADVPRDMSWIAILTLLAEASDVLVDDRQASILYDLLSPYRQRVAMAGVSALSQGPVALYLGLLATRLRRWDAASTHLRESLEIGERMGLRPFVARTFLAQAGLHAARDEAGDRAKALGCLERAEAAAREIGMAGLYDRIAALRDRLAPSGRGRFDLTPRELDVLRLVAEGLTDIEVAERLYLSRRTVSTHLTSIYTKLGVSSRTAAARFAVEHALI
jgi:DNA-binding CsgD family transcriptional regulator